ncbi:MAG: bifunctional precorrin-2 dehydrogenase/sirohydrochlorin ferrochelatase [Acidobacteria bacterium]|jgi:precorrin-2 dehydrogenase/sirohydrochlorin ferrochelatase|nr:bifunctional precorrin-2 dehydrogenase/sirohydrochlorin ferrochelatase [Acidobacteriota bacterium]
MKSFMPVSIEVSKARIVIIGGGKVAHRKLRTIVQYANDIHVYAPEILPEIKLLPVSWTECPYSDDLLTEASLVYACTNDSDLNRRICQNGKNMGALVSSASDSGDCDFLSPAIFQHENMSVAVSSNGRQVRNSIIWRDAIRAFILEDLIHRR